MAKYRINFVGFAYVEADDEAQAIEVFWNDDADSEEYEIDSVELVID